MALEKAAGLIDASHAGVVDARTQREFDRHVRKALSAIETARAEVAAAASAVDGGLAPGHR